MGHPPLDDRRGHLTDRRDLAQRREPDLGRRVDSIDRLSYLFGNDANAADERRGRASVEPHRRDNSGSRPALRRDPA